MNQKIKIAVCNGKTDKKYHNQEQDWDDIVSRNRTPVRTSETVEEYAKLPKKQRDECKDHGGFVGGWLTDGIRKKGNVISRMVGMLDADSIPDNSEFLQRCRAALGGGTYFIYSTHSHTRQAPRYRVVILFSRAVSEAEYPPLMRMVAKQIGIDYFDDSTYQANRMMFWASCPVDGDFVFEENRGAALDPDHYLCRYPNWRDASQWPTSNRQAALSRRSLKCQADPLEKVGIVGAFCRAYGIQEAIETFLSDIYQASAVPGRYDYIPADSSAGLVVYDDKFAYSHHSTDPAWEKELNAFDLVRIHQFGDPDDQKSFQAMADFASQNEKVKGLLLAERQARAVSDFDDGDDDSWQQQLEYEARSTVLKNSLRNLTLILKNDKNLKGIVFNQQLDGLEIRDQVPWQHPSKYWRDADDAQLISYVDAHYGDFSARNYQIAVAKVTDDRSYHPIREYLEALPAWDQVQRLDTLLIDYLGADDNDYVRAVSRKTLCGAVMRVLKPGCKFDSMLVLNGPQGVGKSTLIARLAGEWFSDSLNLGDTKDKTAAEKLQGYWILEIGELAGLRKAEVETLRSFLSRQNDIYRAAFGKRATPHQRQCIFFGTTNAESGYLRDTTGNRRFWPVKTPGGGRHYSWEITAQTVQQIWAEALVYVKAGEPLYLDARVNQLAKMEQREAMEADEREGLVRDYLDTLLPDNWESMDLFERRNYLNGTGLADIGLKGQVKRTAVCNMEIWCECFGKERANLKRIDSNELSSILIRLDWQRLPTKGRTDLYGPQFIFVPKTCS
ncbi:MAG: virulence-associated E family protein [Acetobacterium sp.]|nr:virulence-associated E family protein [Acetobacterium sp.]